MVKKLTLFLLIAALMNLNACGRSGRGVGKHLILITVDTLRADHLSCYGNPEIYTPNMDVLAKEGLLFETCIVPMGKTTPSLATLLTAKYPHEHTVRSVMDALPEEVDTLAEILKEHGFTTAFANANILLTERSGITQGFDYYEDLQGTTIELNDKNNDRKNDQLISAQKKRVLPENRPTDMLMEVYRKSSEKEMREKPHEAYSAKHLTDLAVNRLDSLKDQERIFLWVHYMDPHWDYMPPYPWKNIHSKQEPESFMEYMGQAMPIIQFKNTMSDELIRYFKGLYTEEVEYTDYHIGRLLRKLCETGLYDESLIVFSADHGEALGEKDIYFGHGDDLYEGNLRVPLIFLSKNGIPDNRLSDYPVEFIDLFQTFCDLLAVPVPAVSGNSIADIVLSGSEPETPPDHDLIFAETDSWSPEQNPRKYIDGIQGKWRMAMNDRYKLIWIPHREESIYELYDWKNDPAELNNLAGKGMNVEENLRDNLHTWVARDASYKDDSPQKPPEDSRVLEKLRELGYIQ